MLAVSIVKTLIAIRALENDTYWLLRESIQEPSLTMATFKFDSDYVGQIYKRTRFVCHKNVLPYAASRIKSPTVQKSFTIPAAIAGVVRRVMCRFTKL